jgi:cyclohexanone monooxygenase
VQSGPLGARAGGGVIDDPIIAGLLIPTDHPIGTKRICTDSNYFQTFNRPNVSLISVTDDPK